MQQNHRPLTCLRWIGLALMLASLPIAAQARTKPKPVYQELPEPLPAGTMMGNHCVPTAQMKTHNYPGAALIPTVNYLQRPAGKAVSAVGQTILLTGQILDSACVPVSGATVEIWQNDPYGRWILSNGEDLVDTRPVFNGAGRTSTDNQGVFHFITLYPAATSRRAPNLNLRISLVGMRAFETVLYFAGDQRNMTDADFTTLTPPAQRSIGIVLNDNNPNALDGNITLMLPGKMPYRGY